MLKYFILFIISLNIFNKGICNSKSDSLKIATWNIQMLPRVYAPISKWVRKKQKVSAK